MSVGTERDVSRIQKACKRISKTQNLLDLVIVKNEIEGRTRRFLGF